MDGSDCRGYRTTRRNLPSSIAYRPPFTAISRNIGVIDMQTSHTTASAAATTSLARRIVAASWKPVLFAVLMWLSAAAGEIPIPGTPVPITLQTFVVMLAGLMLPWRQAGAAVATYLAAGAVGLPVFAGGTSTLALVGQGVGDEAPIIAFDLAKHGPDMGRVTVDIRHHHNHIAWLQLRVFAESCK